MNHVEYFKEAEKVLGPSTSGEIIDQLGRIAGIHNRYGEVIEKVSRKFRREGKEKAAKRVLIESIRSYQKDINGGRV
jgi:hypothetical protein